MSASFCGRGTLPSCAAYVAFGRPTRNSSLGAPGQFVLEKEATVSKKISMMVGCKWLGKKHQRMNKNKMGEREPRKAE